MGERLLTEESTDRSLFDMGYWEGLSAYRMINTKEEETGVSEVIKIIFDNYAKRIALGDTATDHRECHYG